MLISGNDKDFKYFMQDIEKMYFGAKYTYNELMLSDTVPFKLKTVIEKYILDGIDPDTTLESHLYYMTEDSFSYRVYKQLKARARVSQYKSPQTVPGREIHYAERVYLMRELVALSPEEKAAKGIVIREVIISKLALFSFTI